MFTHLRYLAAASLLIMLIGASYIAITARDYKEDDLLQTVGQQNRATVASFTNSVWSSYAGYIVNNPTSEQFPNFVQMTRVFFVNHPIAKLTIFSPDLTSPLVYYGTGDQYVTTNGTTKVTLFEVDQAKNGKPVNRLLRKVYFNGSNEPNKPRTMVQTILPITTPGHSKPDALVEIYSDVTDSLASLNNKLMVFLGTILGIFTLLIAVLLLTTRRAETIITKQHEVNLELIAAAAQAEAQSRDKSQFLASVSHELRTPLNAIIGFSDIIRNEARDNLQKIYQDYLDDIHASGKHLLSLINDILDFSKAEAGKLQIEWAETDATKVIRNSLRMVMPRAEAAQVTLVEDIPAQHLVVVTDAKKLKQVLLNLLSNAVKFTLAGGEVRCHAWTDVLTGSLHIQVRDTGIGIAPKDISRVMTPFGQVDSALSRKYEGTGLGLPLSKKFVESMGGSFTIESQLKVGTSVTISVPKQPPGWGTAAMTLSPEKKEDADVVSKNKG